MFPLLRAAIPIIRIALIAVAAFAIAGAAGVLPDSLETIWRATQIAEWMGGWL